MTDRDVMEYDVTIVGGGPAGLACAIRLKQLKPTVSVCLLEKGSEINERIRGHPAESSRELGGDTKGQDVDGLLRRRKRCGQCQRET